MVLDDNTKNEANINNVNNKNKQDKHLVYNSQHSFVKFKEMMYLKNRRLTLCIRD